MALYYNLPSRLTESIGFNNIKLGLIGSNLLLFTENPHFDPELNAVQERSVIYGVDDFSYPSTRSFGFSVKTEVLRWKQSLIRINNFGETQENLNNTSHFNFNKKQ